MGRITCFLETSPRISGRLWGFDGNQAKRFSEGGVASVEVDSQGKLLELKVKSGERIIGGQFNFENQAVLWTEKGNIYKLNFGQNRYWKVGKPGVVSCANYQLTPPTNLLVGLQTGRALVIDTETGAIRCRFVENCDILGVGGSTDGSLVFTQCRDHVTVWDIGTKQAKLRLGLQPGASLEFVRILPGGSAFSHRVVTAARDGKIAVWGIRDVAGKISEDKLDFLGEVDISGGCEQFCVTEENLYVATQTEVVKVDLATRVIEKIVNIPSGERLCNLDVKTFGTQTVIVMHLGGKSLFLRNAEIVDQVFSAGFGWFSKDGFLMAKIKPDGSVEFYRTDGSWNKQAVKAAAKTVDQATNVARVENVEKQIAVTNKTSVNTAAPSDDKVDHADINKAERDYDQLLTQITTPTLLPLLRSGPLSYPPLPRPTIWANLLHLPRNKRIYLKFCKSHNSSPEEILSNIFLWSPHLKLVPHVPSFISSFLSLFSGHPTTSFEFCLTLLSRYTWLSSYPSHPPVFPLAWSLLSSECPSLISHLSSISVTSRTLFWPLLQSGWSSILPYPDWAKLWDHLITAGPELLITALPATISCLQTILLSCTSSTMVDNLLSSQLALNMDELLTTAHSLLDKHHLRVTSVVHDKGAAGVITDAGYPPQIRIGREEREVLRDVWSDVNSDSVGSSSTTSTLPVKQRHTADYGQVVRKALAVSPPPIPRARTNQRAALTNKENLGFRPAKEHSSFQTSKENFNPLAPLQPAYPPTIFDPQELQPILSKPSAGEEGWEDITALLHKAKLLRQVIQAKK